MHQKSYTFDTSAAALAFIASAVTTKGVTLRGVAIRMGGYKVVLGVTEEIEPYINGVSLGIHQGIGFKDFDAEVTEDNEA